MVIYFTYLFIYFEAERTMMPGGFIETPTPHQPSLHTHWIHQGKNNSRIYVAFEFPIHPTNLKSCTKFL